MASSASDVVVASYVFSEIAGAKLRAQMAKRLWARTKGCLVIVEPGTPAGAEVVQDLRHVLLSAINTERKKAQGRERSVAEEEGEDERVGPGTSVPPPRMPRRNAACCRAIPPPFPFCLL